MLIYEILYKYLRTQSNILQVKQFTLNIGMTYPRGSRLDMFSISKILIMQYFPFPILYYITLHLL